MTTSDTSRLAGQRIMAGFDGTVMNDDVKQLIQEMRVGGLILFARNIDSPNQTAELCASAQAFARENRLPPLFIAMDQEGGEVARLKPPFFTGFPGNPCIRNEKDALDFAVAVAGELKALNVNMNLAPVLDCSQGTENSIMKNRTFPGSPDNVAVLGSTVINQLQDQGIMACAKHFPGIGRTCIDSHLDLPALNTGKEQLDSSDLVPFLAAVRNNVAAVMLSHILYTKIDSRWPASLSPRIAKQWLRDEIGFQGIVMTDDLDMKAVKHGIKTAVHQILTSEIDMALICHKGPDIETAFHEIKRLLASDETFHTKGVESFKRIVKAKEKYITTPPLIPRQ
ncbi:MAG: beta-N-acetylhexosaminidase [Desulfobacteraceae bacterium]